MPILILLTPVFPALTLLGALVTAATLRDGSYLSRASYDEMVFLRPVGQRLVTGLLGVTLAAAPPAALSPLLRHGAPLAAWAALALEGSLMLASGGILLRLSGPASLHLDLAARRYRRVGGWPLVPRAATGPWEDMHGICLRTVGAALAPVYLVGVVFAVAGRGPAVVEIGRFRQEAAARQFALEVASALDMPLSAPTPP